MYVCLCMYIKSHLLVGGGPGMDDEGLCIAHVGNVRH